MRGGRLDRLAAAQKASHDAAQKALAESLPTYTFPIADSRYTSPGWAYLGETISGCPDVAYPYDPAVLAAIREFEPSAMPIVIRSTWQHCDYGNLEPPITLTRHGIARYIPDLRIPGHEFGCELPVHDEPWTFPTARVHGQHRPTYVELNHYDRNDRPYGMDVPGAYLPFDWSLYRMLHETYESNRRAKDIWDDILVPMEESRDRNETKRIAESAYVHKTVGDICSDEVSDREWKEAMFGSNKQQQSQQQTGEQTL